MGKRILFIIIHQILIIIFSSVNKFKETDYNKNLSNKNNEILRKYSYFKKSADGYVAGLLDLYEGGYTHSVNSSTGFSSSGHGTWSQSGESIIFTKTGGTAIEGTARIQHLQTGEIMLVFDNRSMNKIWFRVKQGSTGPISVRVEAWAKE